MHYINKRVLTKADGSTTNGDTQDSQLWVAASFQVITGGVADGGTVKIQISNQIIPGYSPGATLPTVTNWSDLPNATSTVASGVGPPITVTNFSYRWCRAVYTKSGGTESIVVDAFAIYP